LEKRETGPAAQNAEELALDRLDGMLQAFAQTASEATPKPNTPPQNSAPTNPQQQAQQPQRRPTFELLQVKMLRMLQADLNSRTQQLQERVASSKPAEAVALRKEAQDLSTEQGRLVKLVESLLRGDNEEEPPK
jgi:FtsZ-interacting cell division protein ZipA